MGIEIKPCPFCGDIPNIYEEYEYGKIKGYYIWNDERYKKELCYGCHQEDFIIDTKEELVQFWNKRAENPKIEQLEAKLNECIIDSNNQRHNYALEQCKTRQLKARVRELEAENERLKFEVFNGLSEFEKLTKEYDLSKNYEYIELFLKKMSWQKIWDYLRSRGCEDTIQVKRFEDDSPDGVLTITKAIDGDMWIDVFPKEPFHSFRFRTGQGGGRSKNTHSALFLLLVAIMRDNEISPQNRENPPESGEK